MGDKDAIQLKDEMIGLQKMMNTLTQERDLARAKLRKLEGELSKKDKQIEDLLVAGHIPVGISA